MDLQEILTTTQNFRKYFFACLASLCVDYGLTAAGIAFGVSPYIALIVGGVIGGATGFLLLTFWVFPTKGASFSPRRIGGYILSLFLVYVIRSMCIWLWNQCSFPDNYIYAGLFIAYGCSFFTNYFFQKYAVFMPPAQQSRR